MENIVQKIRFKLDPGEWHGSSSEGVWAESLYDQSNQVFVIKNVPFFVKGIGYLDIVLTKIDGGIRFFDKVVSHSGHSTYRIICEKPMHIFKSKWSKIESLGCSYESTTFFDKKILYAVDIPESSDIKRVYEILEEGENENIWLFEEGFVGQKS